MLNIKNTIQALLLGTILVGGVAIGHGAVIPENSGCDIDAIDAKVRATIAVGIAKSTNSAIWQKIKPSDYRGIPNANEAVKELESITNFWERTREKALGEVALRALADSDNVDEQTWNNAYKKAYRDGVLGSQETARTFLESHVLPILGKHGFNAWW